MEAGASKSSVDSSQIDKLTSQIERLKAEATALRAERDDFKMSLAQEREAGKRGIARERYREPSSS